MMMKYIMFMYLLQMGASFIHTPFYGNYNNNINMFDICEETPENIDIEKVWVVADDELYKKIYTGNSLLGKINENIKRKKILKILLRPDLSSVIKMEILDNYLMLSAIKPPNLSGGGLYKDWDMVI